jgi:Rps23 Pro-64 3,4-dihydroxylase Tpa1-like proline 4-hydroxylase
MEFTFIDEGIDAVIIDNFYSEEQLELIFSELKTLTHPDIMQEDRNSLESAVDLQGNFITNKAGLWLDAIYNKWTYSHMMRFLDKNLNSQQFRDKLMSKNSLYKIMFNCRKRGHLLSYYENAGYYSKHTDASAFTILSYFNKEPKHFTGGDITIHSFDESKKVTIESRNNRVIIITGNTSHEVSEIQL